jgi:hypothetical protein
MSQNKLISIKNPIVDAMEMLGVDHDRFLPMFTNWATIAENDIGSYFQYVKKRTVIDIENCTACLPSDCMFLQRALYGDYGCDCEDLFMNVCSNITQISSADQTNMDTSGFLIVDITGGGSTVWTSIPHVVQNNKIILDKNYNGQKLTIQYLGLETDCDGFVMISQNHVQAIMWNIIWKYYFQKKAMNSLEYGKMNDAKVEWNRECAHARAVDGELTESERDRIVTMLHDPYIGKGLALQPTGANNYIW